MQQDQPSLNSIDNQIIEDEQKILQRVAGYLAEKLAAAQTKPKEKSLQKNYTQELIELRDQVAEARLEDVPALVSQMLQAAALASEARPTTSTLVDHRSPYFGHLRLKEKGRERDVLIGKSGTIERKAGVVIVDWRHAPISQLYYKHEEGDDYEEIYGGEEREGEIVARRMVSIKNGNLKRVRCPQGNYNFQTGQWHKYDINRNYEMKGGAGVSAMPKKTRPKNMRQAQLGLGEKGTEYTSGQLEEITALIDPQQFQSMTQQDSGLMILQGGAGSGKTTIALHRIAWLTFNYPEKYRAKRIRVIVYSEALVRYVRRVLPALGLPQIKVSSYHQWAKNLFHRVVDFPNYKFSNDTSDEVANLKKHTGMLHAIEKQINRQKVSLKKEILSEVKDPIQRERFAAPFLQILNEPAWVPALIQIKKMVVQNKQFSHFEREKMKKHLDQMLTLTTDFEGQWEELITDTELLSACLDGKHGMSPTDFKAALSWTKEQISIPDDAHIDSEAKKPIDNHEESLPHGQLDPYDATLVLNMVIARYGCVQSIEGRPIILDHVSVDEAQDLSPVELNPLHVMTAPYHSMTLAGDTKQKMFFDNGCETWEDLIEPVGGQAETVETFKLIYRSTAPIAEFAHQVLGPLAPENPPKTIKDGTPVCIFPFDEQGEEIAFLAEQLRGLMNREPYAHVCVLTRYPEQATQYFQQLSRCDVPQLRHQDGPDFRFTPGIDVTHLRLVKGLEYDYVVMVGVDKASYPDDFETRHLLHIGATRAAHQLWLTTKVTTPSPLLDATTFILDAF